MISIDQIRQLETGVRQAVDIIQALREENGLLKTKLSGYEKRIEELEVLIDSFKQDQSSIEEGIIHALHQLDVLEDIVSKEETEPASDTSKADKTSSPEPEKTESEVLKAHQNETTENELDIF